MWILIVGGYISLCCQNYMVLSSFGSTVLVGIGLIKLEDSRSHSDTPHSVRLLRTSDFAGRGDPYLTTNNKHKKHTLMPPGGIRTRNPSKRAAVDPRELYS